ncbi:hypothetical protein [Shewanella zhangzhouensis]|uniref:hypothetical protein n=1 Tax=Shewanella zhangzhouensis TaxID=2864213 RepID=UPI001C65A8AC|nr:hypothetical protein [Shewanella zhangzhouensis]QYK05835.1 hypothetical protein K0H63_03050 [Shewanella zhangzhouensis]
MEDTNKKTTGGTEYIISAEQLRKAFYIHLLMGIAVAIMLNLLNLNVFLGVILGGGVIGSYFWQFKKGKEPHGLMKTFSDSVYYLGFILTLMSLIVAMMFFNVEQGVNAASAVITQFGAAMTTTLVGMALRIYYQNFDMTVESAQLSAKETLEQTVKSFNVQMRSTNRSLSTLSKAMDESIQEAEKRNKISMELYEKTQESIQELSKNALEDFTKTMEHALKSSLERLDNYSTELASKLELMIGSVVDTNRDVHKNSLDELKFAFSESFEMLKNEMQNNLNSLEKGSKSASEELSATASQVNKLNIAIENAAGNLQGLDKFAANVTILEQTQHKFITAIEGLSQKITEKSTELMAGDRKLSQHIFELSGEYKRLLEQYRQLTAGEEMQKLLQEESNIIEELKNRREQIARLNAQWEKDSHSMSNSSKAFTENLIKTAKFITEELSITNQKTEQVRDAAAT